MWSRTSERVFCRSFSPRRNLCVVDHRTTLPASQHARPPDGPDWLHDGYRLIVPPRRARVRRSPLTDQVFARRPNSPSSSFATSDDLSGSSGLQSRHCGARLPVFWSTGCMGFSHFGQLDVILVVMDLRAVPYRSRPKSGHKLELSTRTARRKSAP